MKLCLKDLTGAATMLAAALGLSLIGPHRAYAAPGGLSVPGASDLDVKILSPDPNTPLIGLKPVDISAFYQGTPGNRIVAVELYLDGKRAASRTLDVPETRGVISFLVDAAQLSPGAHRVVVRVTAADQEVKSVRAAFQFGDPGVERMSSSGLPGLGDGISAVRTPAAPTAGNGPAPTLHLFDPSENGKVQGVVTVRVKATDPSGKNPYVSLSIDKVWKTLRNFAPYEFEWDTTAYPNGYHTIEVAGYSDSDTSNVGHAPALRVYVNNPGGETSIRHDLLDGVKAVQPRAARRAARKSASRKSVGRPLPLRRPDLLTADERITEAPKAAKTSPAKITPPLLASVMPAHVQSTREIVRHLVRGASSLRFGPVDALTELSTPFVSEAPTAPAPVEVAPRITPPARAPLAARAHKPMPTAAAAPDPNIAALADLTRSARRVSGKIARLQRMAGLRLPDSDLASPYLAAPRDASLPARPVVKIAAYRAQMTEQMAHSTIRTSIKPVMKMHPLRVHLPASLGSLLHSIGQTSVLFNHTTVHLDRPLAAQGGVLFGPLRQIFEQGGGTLTWQSRTGTVRARSATKNILLRIGDSRAVVNAKAVTLDGKPYLMMGRTMVPLSFVTAAMDADVQYDAATGHLLITSRK